MRDKKLSSEIFDLSYGVLTSVSDVILYTFLLFGSSFFTSPTSRGIYKSFNEADQLFEEINTKTIINALTRLRSQTKSIKLIKQSDKSHFEITEFGRKRLNEILPIYKTYRPWDGNLYLVAYDIPEKNKKIRGYFRKKLKNIGAGLLQESLWLSPYNPSGILSELLKNFHLQEYVIMTPFNKSSAFANEGIETLIEKVYRLQDLNKRYQEFINQNKKKSSLRSAFQYFSILKEDPQLPFELEPKWFSAKKAYSLFLSLKP